MNTKSIAGSKVNETREKAFPAKCTVNVRKAEISCEIAQAETSLKSNYKSNAFTGRKNNKIAHLLNLAEKNLKLRGKLN